MPPRLRLAVASTALALAAGVLPAHAAPAPSVAPPRFTYQVSKVTAARLGRSWRAGCPVGPRRLRLVRLTHWGFDHRVHRGELVVHERAVHDVVYVLGKAFAARFPIRRMRTMAAYGGSDPAAMADDNTSAFNCRAVTGNSGVRSQHSYGDALDVNTLENPYVDRRGRVHPAAGVRYLDRRRRAPGMLRAGDAVTTAMRRVGWAWGARWAHPDYQHFSANGR
ncbi:M15 family metallopeptidase [Streptomyces longispororuber]|uniref:M15 family metallopeptidase n=1 Tax=Streptomyces longispororuber TaxID=68230 RepID=UPI00210BC081|nr:M15 family metallopeptidase [Streptomyces longispororuber]MCQ4211205.1 M15 family metallopeptidase [Streptomyces longispororuber]